MKRNLKRLPALLLAVILCLSLLPGTAWATDIVIGDSEEWRIDDTYTLYIDSDAGMKDWIHENGAFGGWVVAVDLADSITEIPYHAFWKCTNLTTVEIPASVTEMGKNDVFEGCKNLTTITVAAGNKNFTAVDGILYNTEKTAVLICPPGKSGDVTLPNTVTRIAGSAFKGCAKLSGVTLHEGISSIENVVFDGCNGLTTLTLPASLTSLGNGAFDNCAGLTSLTVADGNSKFSSEDGVLYNNTKTELLLYPMAKSNTNFTIPDSVTRIASYAFKGARYLQTVTAGDLTSIESSAFMNCESLTSFSAESLGEVKLQAFYQCAKLETFTLTDEDSLTTIGNDAFSRCSSLTAAPIAGATSIGDRAFQSCTALTSLAFCETDNVTIGSSAFSGCTGLTELTFPESVKSIGGSAFGGCNKVTVITFESETPPTCYSYSTSFSVGDPNNFQIVVPNGSENAYIQALGDTLGSYVGDTLVKKYPLFVNGQQFTSETTTITCGEGTASFDVATSTLTLTNATINTMGGNYGYGGAINSGLAELTIKLVGTNTINAEQEQWGTTYRDSINSGANCDVKIVGGESDGSMPTLVCDLIDMGRGGSGFTGGAGEGNLTVDGVNLTVNDRIFVHHNTTFQNGAQVNVTGGLTVNNSATVTVTGETTAVTVKYIALGNDLPGQTNRLVLEAGTLTITGSVAYPGAPDGDTNPYAIRFDPVSSGSIAINGGMFVKQASCAGTNIDESEITQADNLPVQGSWDSGTLIIGPANDGKYLVTVKSDPTDGGVAYGGGRYDEDEEVTLTATANQGYYFIGWYKAGQEEAVNTNTEYTFTVPEDGITLTARFGVDYLTKAEQAKTNFESAVNTDAFEWQTLVQAVDAYKAAESFVKNPPSGIENAQDRYAALAAYYSSVQALDLSAQNISSADLAKLSLFTGVTELNLSGNKGVSDLSNLPNPTGLETLNLSGTGVSDLSALERLTNLETLDLSNTAITNDGLSILSGLTDKLKNLDISGTRVTALDKLVPEGSFIFPGSETLTAKNLSLTSLSALAGVIKADGFADNDIEKWDFTGSTLTDSEENKADVKAIQDVLGDRFTPPTILTTPTGGGGGATTYAVTVEKAEHGKVTASPSSASSGTPVTITVTPDEGYELEKLTVTDSKGSEVKLTDKGNGKYTFDMPNSEVEIKAVFRKIAPVWENCPGGVDCPAYSYRDVDTSAWYHEAVDYVLVNGLMSGYGNGVFGPNDHLSRAQLCQILYNKEGRPAVTGSSVFTDVAGTAWYADAVIWANTNGVVGGYGGGLFGPDDPITREQLAAILWRYAGSPESNHSLDAFTDAGQISDWAMDAMRWANENGVLNGDGSGHLIPRGNATRAHVAQMIQNFLENIGV